MPSSRFEPFFADVKPFALGGAVGGRGADVVAVAHPPLSALEALGTVADDLAEHHRLWAIDFPGTAASRPVATAASPVAWTLALDALRRSHGIEARAVVAL